MARGHVPPGAPIGCGLSERITHARMTTCMMPPASGGRIGTSRDALIATLTNMVHLNREAGWRAVSSHPVHVGLVVLNIYDLTPGSASYSLLRLRVFAISSAALRSRHAISQ